MAKILRPRFATFGRGPDTQKRKKRGFGGYIAQGAKYGAATGATAGTALAAAGALGRLRSGLPLKPGLSLATAGVMAGGGAAGLLGTGALIGAGAYGVNKFLNRNKKEPVALPPTKRQKVINTYNNLKSRIRGTNG